MHNSITILTMKNYRNHLLSFSILFCLSISYAFGQENCTNGVDDDGDGYIDCYDGDCAGGASCSEFYFGNSVLCAEEPTENPTFAIRTEWVSADETANSHALPAIGDIDQDGTPEVVVTNRQAKTVSVLDGVTGQTEFQISLSFEPENAIVLANLENDDCAEMIIVENVGNDIIVYDCNQVEKWRGTSSRNNIGLPAVADFDGDGNVELYYKNEIRNALTGTILVTGSGNWDRDFVHSPIAVDVFGDSDLELITGDDIWSVDLAAGTLTRVADMDTDLAASGFSGSYHPKYYSSWDDQWSAISVADFNLDGNIDVLTSGALGSGYWSTTSVFFWDIANGEVKVYQDGGNNFIRGTGRINIGDTDGDGSLNATYVSDQVLYSLHINPVTGVFEPLWTKAVKEGSSGFTGCSLFDFDGDGAFETIYRSESALLIIDGTDGTTRKTLPCISRTQEEYPIVADIDGDGASEICVACYTSDATPFNPYSNTQYSHIRVFGADGEAWQPSRSVWNQHAYFNVNINDDLTVPLSQQDHTSIFSTDVCTTGPNRFLNTFLNQSPFVDETGCPSYVSPDIDLDGASISATASSCPATGFSVSFDISNTGDADISGSLPVTFYAGDPLTSNSTKLNTEIVVLLNFVEGETRTITLDVEGIGGDFDLYISINDFGQTPPITPYSASIPECETDNNIASVSVTHTPFTLTVDKLKDNQKCDPSKPDNGQAQAYFDGTIGGGVETVWFEDFNDPDLNGDKNDTAGDSQWSSSAAGTPSFYGVNNSGFMVWNSGGNNEDKPVTWLSEIIDISGHTDVTFSADMISEGGMEASGKSRDVMRVYYKRNTDADFVLLTEGYGDFEYQQATISGINANSLQIKVTMHSTANDEKFTLDNVSVTGTSGPTTKKFTDVDGFEFYWYNQGDFSTVLFSGSTYPTMADGNYSVVGYTVDGNCYSDTVNITIDLDDVPDFEVHVYEISPLTDCADPDGELRAFAYTQTDGSGDPIDTLEAGYSFTWTLSSDAGGTTIGAGSILSNLEAIGYFVEVEYTLSGCVMTGSEVVSSSLSQPPVPDVSLTHITTCGGTGAASASIGGNTSDYDFQWYIGSTLKPAPDYTTASISSLPAGNYTVRAIEKASSCPGDPVTVTINDNSTGPKPTVTIIQHNTSCETGASNGSASADGDGAGTTSGYTFTWYVGTTTANANKLPGAVPGSSVNGATASGLPDGIYSVTVKKGGCTVKRTFEILEQSSAPEFNFITSVNAGSAINFSNKSWIEIPQAIAGWEEITLSYWVYLANENYLNDHLIFSSGGTGEDQVVLWTDNTDGLAFVVKTEGDGSRGRINTNYKPTGWTQLTGVWSAVTDLNGDGNLGDMAIYADGVLLGTDNYLGNGNGLLNAGTEMYVARDRNLGTNKFEGRFDELRIFNKAFTPLEINEAVCAETVGTESGLIVYYDFDGLSDVSDGANIPNRATGVNSNVNVNTGQSGAFYDGTVQLQAQGTIAYVTSDINCPLGYAQNNTTCDPANPNGSMDLTGKIDPDGGNYEYVLYDGYSTDTELSTITAPSSPIFTGLPAGFYTIEVIDLDTDCSTGTLAFAIADIVDEPSIITTLTDDSGCNATGTGQIFVQAYSDNSEPSSYTFELFDGATLDPGSSLGTTTVANGNTGFTYTDLTDGTYRILVTNDDILCDFYKDVIISDVSTTPTISSITAIDNVYCSSNSGFLNVNMPGGTDGDYTYTFYAGETTSDPLIVADTVSDVLNGLAGGKYTVVAKSKTTGCETAPQTKTIIDDPAYPNVVTSEVTPATGCNATAGGGSIEAYVQDPDNPGITYVEPDYSFQWYLGSVAPGNEVDVANDGDQSTATNLPSATYYVVVTDTETGCVTSTANITLSQTPIKPVLTVNTLTPNTSCDPTGTTGPTGGVSVNVSFNGSAVVDPDASGYTFTWYEGSGTAGQNITVDGTSNGSTPSGESTSSISNITNMTYTVVAVGPNGCSSDPIQGVVGYSPANPQIDTISISNNTVCDVAVAGNYDGEIVVSPVTGVVSDYEFLWYEGVGTGGTQVTNTTTSDDVVNEASAYYLEGSPIGKKYTLEMTNLGNGCVSEFSFEIKDIPAQPIIVLNESEVRNNTTCSDSPNGSIVAAIDLNNAVVNGRANDEIFQNISSCNTSVLDNATEVGANGFQLTTETTNQFGRIWLGDSIDLAEPLRLDFRILLGSRDANGADGIAFTMHRDPRGYDARGRVGGDLGVGQVLGGGSFTKIQPAVSIEFDTWDNGSSDPSYDHTNLFFNGNITTTALGVSMGSLPQIHASKTNVEDGDTLDVSILVTQSGSDQVFELWVEGSLRFIYTGDVINDIFGGESKVIGGFTSSTGGSYNNQAVFLEPVLGEYDFAWTDNLGNPVGGNVPFICGVGPGDYTLTVTNSSTGCVSDTETFTVEDELTAIDAELTVTQQPSACSGGTPDGILTAVVNNDDGGDYSFKFYSGSGVGADGTELNGVDTLNPVLNGRAAGIYTVKVTDLQDPDGSCYATDEVNLLVNKPVVVLSGTAYGVTDCGTLSNGSYKINSLTEDGIPGNVGDYEFDVYDGDGDFVNTYTSDSITNLSEGGYSIIPVNPSTNCEFSGHNINIGDAIVLPSATLNPIGAGSNTANNTVCDTTYVTTGDSYNGAIEVTPDAGVAADYTFTWFFGASTNAGDALLTQLPNAVIETGDTLIRNIPGGTYTLVMQNTANACRDTLEFDILSTPAANPVIDNTTPGVDYIVSDVTACNADNGSIEILEVDGSTNLAGKYFLWYAGADTTGTQVAGHDSTALVSGLATGQYTVFVADSASGCTSTPVSFFVDESFDTPSATLNPIGAGSNTANNTVCDTTYVTTGDSYNGAIEVTPDAGVAADYTFTWFFGASTNAGDALLTQLPNAVIETGDTLIRNIPGGTYTLVMQNNANACLDTLEFDILSTPAANPVIDNTTPGVDYIVSDVTACNADNGAIEILEVDGSTNLAGKYFLWYAGADTTGTQVAGHDSTALVSGLATGQYTVFVADSASGCTSTPVSFFVDESFDTPSATLNPIGAGSNTANNTVCDTTYVTTGDSYNGAIEVTPDAGVAADYTFTWFFGASTNAGDALLTQLPNAVIETGDTLIRNIPGGTYTLVMQNNANACLDTLEFDILSTPAADPVIDNTTPGVDYIVSDVTACNADNGAIEILEVDGSTNLAGKYFLWYAGADTTGTQVAGHDSTALVSGLATGQYTVFVADSASGCTSTPVSFFVDESFDTPSATLNPIGAGSNTANNTVCDTTYVTTGDSYNGAIEVTPDAGVAADYTFTWFFGASTNAGDALLTQLPNAVIETGDTLIRNIPGGTYTLVMQNNANACLDTLEFDILSTPAADPVIDNTTPGVDYIVSDVTACNADNGAIEILEVDGSTNLAGKYFLWYAGADTTGTQVAGHDSTALVSGLATGQYTVFVADSTSGCTSTPVSFFVDESFDTPSATLNPIGAGSNTANNTVCDTTYVTTGDSYNGAIEVTPDAGVAADYTFTWFFGASTNAGDALLTQLPNAVIETGDTLIRNIPGGTYTLVMQNNANACLDTLEFDILSTPAANPVIDNTTPGVDYIVSDVTACNADNGAIEILEVDGSTNLAGKYFLWYAGADTTGTQVAGHDSTALVSGLATGQYTVFVADSASGCTSTPVSFFVDESFDTPSATLNPIGAGSNTANNTVCDTTYVTTGDSYNGAIEVTPDAGVAADYTFTWFFGASTNAGDALLTQLPNAVIETGDTLIRNIPGGTYTLVMQNNANACLDTLEFDILSTPAADPVIDNTTPGVDYIVSDVTACNADNGAIEILEVDGSTNLAGKYFLWYAGADTTGTQVAGHDSTALVSGLATGQYTVFVADSASGCTSTPVSFFVDESFDTPSATLNPIGAGSNTANNTVCDTTYVTTGDSYNGAIEVTPDAGVAADYTFTWFFGASTNAGDALLTQLPNAVIETGDTLIRNIPGGTYTLVMQNNANACLDTLEFDILSTPAANPVIDNTTPGVDYIVSDVTACNADNGAIEILEVDGSTNLAGKYFLWYAGADTTGTQVAGHDSTALVSGLATGQYTVFVADSASGCTSTPVSFFVDESFDTPSATLNPIGAGSNTANNTVCDTTYVTTGDSYNGAIEVTPDAGVAADYTFTWFFGASTNAGDALLTQLPNAVIETGDTLIRNIPGGTYTLVMQNNANACLDTLEFDILSTPAANPVIDNTTPGVDYIVSDVTACNADNGAIEILEVDGSTNLAGKYFLWYAGADTTGTQVAGHDSTALVSGLATGQYTVFVADSASGCTSTPVSFFVDESFDTPSATLNPIGAGSNTANNTVCDTTYVTTGDSYNGAIEVTPDAGVAADYTFTWFFGASTNAGDALLTQLPNAVIETGDTLIRNIPGGTYTLVMQNNANACLDTLEFDILSTPAADPVIDNTTPGVDYIISDVTACNADNGAIEILEVDGSTNLAGKYFLWYAGADTTGTQVAGHDSTALVSGLATGQYTVFVADSASGCTSTPVSFFVDESFDTPSATLNPIGAGSNTANNTVCDTTYVTTGDSYNGAIEVTPDAGVAADYTFTWFFGASTNAGDALLTQLPNAVIETGDTLIRNIPGGTYTLVMQNNANACLDTLEFDILSTPAADPVIDNTTPGVDYIVSDVTACNADNGAIEILEVDGSTNLAGKYFLWYAGSDTTGTQVAGHDSTALVTGLATGQYTVFVADSASGCTSTPVSFFVDESFDTPSATLNPIGAGSNTANNTVCDTTYVTTGDSYNGAIEVTPDAGVAADYTFTWFFGASTNAGDALLTQLPNAVIETGDTLIRNIPGGTYTLVMQNNANACLDTLEFDILSTPAADPVIDNTTPGVDYIVSDVTACNADNGSIEILEVDGSTNLAGKYFLWYAGADTTGTQVAGHDSTALVSGLATGQYTVFVADSASGCTSTPVSFFVDESFDTPSATLNPIGAGSNTANNTVCDTTYVTTGDSYNGSLGLLPMLGMHCLPSCPMLSSKQVIRSSETSPEVLIPS